MYLWESSHGALIFFSDGKRSSLQCNTQYVNCTVVNEWGKVAENIQNQCVKYVCVGVSICLCECAHIEILSQSTQAYSHFLRSWQSTIEVCGRPLVFISPASFVVLVVTTEHDSFWKKTHPVSVALVDCYSATLWKVTQLKKVDSILWFSQRTRHNGLKPTISIAQKMGFD